MHTSVIYLGRHEFRFQSDVWIRDFVYGKDMSDFRVPQIETRARAAYTLVDEIDCPNWREGAEVLASSRHLGAGFIAEGQFFLDINWADEEERKDLDDLPPAQLLMLSDPDFSSGQIARKRSREANGDLRGWNLPLEYPIGVQFTSNRLARFETLLLHCSNVDIDGNCVLFCARSGTGKSTLGKNFLEQGYCLLNDERTALWVEGGRVLGAPNPWGGELSVIHAACQPVPVIFFFEQGTQNDFEEMQTEQIFFKLIQNVVAPRYHREHYENIMTTAEKVAGSLRAFRFRCTPDFRAVQAIERKVKSL